MGIVSAAQPVTLSNTGNAALSSTTITPSGDFGETNNCPASLAASANCTINVTFTPTTTGTRSGGITITDNNNGLTGSTQTISLTGTGTAGGGGTTTVTLNPPTLYFESQALSVASAQQPVTLTNTGTASLNISAITQSGDFSETNNCGSHVTSGWGKLHNHRDLHPHYLGYQDGGNNANG